MAIILPHGVLFRGGEEGKIRENLIENDHLETIIGLPSNIFFGTGIPTIILVLRQKRPGSDVLIVDASKGFAKVGKNNQLRASDIRKIADTVTQRLTIPGFSRLVPKREIRENEYNLNIPRYVDSSDPAESYDLYASMFGGIPKSELSALADYWEAFPDLQDALFVDDGTPYVTLRPELTDPEKPGALSGAIREHAEVQRFVRDFETAFADFNSWLRGQLIGGLETLYVPRQESLIGAEIFKRLEPIPLLDKYHAYQLLDDQWQLIAVDLEILQTESFDSARIVDPNLVVKKVKGKDTEVQEGWVGRILPFDLVQETHLSDELAALRAKENRAGELAASIGEALESLSEEEKENDTVHESGDKWVNAAVNKEAKTLRAEAKRSGDFDPESYEAKIIQVADWLAEEKALKAAIKKDEAALHLKTKATIEELGDEAVRELLEAKWITPLGESLHRLHSSQLEHLTGKLQALAAKYQITYADTAREIQETEQELSGMIDELEGNEFDIKGLNELRELLTGD